LIYFYKTRLFTEEKVVLGLQTDVGTMLAIDGSHICMTLPKLT